MQQQRRKITELLSVGLKVRVTKIDSQGSLKRDSSIMQADGQIDEMQPVVITIYSLSPMSLDEDTQVKTLECLHQQLREAACPKCTILFETTSHFI